jgi:hypothetical protein
MVQRRPAGRTVKQPKLQGHHSVVIYCIPATPLQFSICRACMQSPLRNFLTLKAFAGTPVCFDCAEEPCHAALRKACAGTGALTGIGAGALTAL